MNPPVPLLPNDEQGWLWLCRGVRCQLLVRVRLASRRLEAWHRCPLSGGLRSHSYTEKNTVHPCTGIYFRHPRIYMPSFNFFQHAGSAPRLAVCSSRSRASSRVKGRRKPSLVVLQVRSLFALGTNVLSVDRAAHTHTHRASEAWPRRKRKDRKDRGIFFFFLLPPPLLFLLVHWRVCSARHL